MLAAPAPIGELVLGLGLVDGIVDAAPLHAVPWRAGDPPDVAVNLHGRGPQSHQVLASLGPRRLVAFANPGAGHPDSPAWDDGEHEVDRWCRLVRSAGGQCRREDLRLPLPGPRSDLVVVHPGAASASRRWPVHRWKQVVGSLVAAGHRVAVTGTAPEARLCAAVAAAGARDLCGSASLGDLARTVATASLLLCGDTGVAHLATAYRTPSVVLFGPTSPQTWGPAIDPDVHVVLWHGRPDDPPGDPHAPRIDPRLEAVTVDEVLTAVRRVS